MQSKKTLAMKCSIDLIAIRYISVVGEVPVQNKNCFHIKNYFAAIGDRSATPEKIAPSSSFLTDPGLIDDAGENMFPCKNSFSHSDESNLHSLVKRIGTL